MIMTFGCRYGSHQIFTCGHSKCDHTTPLYHFTTLDVHAMLLFLSTTVHTAVRVILKNNTLGLFVMSHYESLKCMCMHPKAVTTHWKHMFEERNSATFGKDTTRTEYRLRSLVASSTGSNWCCLGASGQCQVSLPWKWERDTTNSSVKLKRATAL